MAEDVRYVRFWEARVAPGRLDDAVAWVRAWLQPRAALADGHVGSELFVADADESLGQPPRVVLLTRWRTEPVGLEAVEAVLAPEGDPGHGAVERAHAWTFRPAG